MSTLVTITLVSLIARGQAAAPAETKPDVAAQPGVVEVPAPTSNQTTTVPADTEKPAPAAAVIPSEPAAPGETFVIGKFKTTLYGFAETDVIHDSTRSFIDLAGMSTIFTPGTANGDPHDRTMFSVRNSRLGFRLQAPEVYGIRASGLLEMDFLGNQPANPPQPSFSEAPFWNNPTFRIRHYLLKLDNDYVTVWVGQTWELVGWQGAFQPNTVAIQGIPGELYSRTAQIRALHAFHIGPTTLEIALAALRPPQEDAAIPDFQGGLKLSIDTWTGVQTIGQTSTSIAPAAIGFSGALRQYKLANGVGQDTATATGWAGAADIMLPLIPAKSRKSWALTLVGEFVTGSGDADLYSSLNGGLSSAAGKALAPPGFTGKAGTYAPDVDPGLVGWSSATGSLKTVDWQTFIVSAQLYLPPDGKLWLAGAYSNSLSDDIGEFGSSTSVFFHEIWWDANVFADITPWVRLGLEYSNFTQTYGSGVAAPDSRVQLSAWLIF